MERNTIIISSVQILVILSASYFFFPYASVGAVKQTPEGYSTSLSAIDDAYISSLYPYINRGSDTRLVLANYQTSKTYHAPIHVKILAYIKFDLSNIPSDIEVITAKLELYSMSVTRHMYDGA